MILPKRFSEIAAIAVQYGADTGKPEAIERVVVWKIGRRVVIEVDHSAKVDARLLGFLAFAELPIGGVQVTEVDAVELLRSKVQAAMRQKGKP